MASPECNSKVPSSTSSLSLPESSRGRGLFTNREVDQQVALTNSAPIDLQKSWKRKWADLSELQNVQPPVCAPPRTYSQFERPEMEHTQQPQLPRNPFMGGAGYFLETPQQQAHRLNPRALPATVTHREMSATPRQYPVPQAAAMQAPVAQARIYQSPFDQSRTLQAPTPQIRAEQVPVAHTAVERTPNKRQYSRKKTMSVYAQDWGSAALHSPLLPTTTCFKLNTWTQQAEALKTQAEVLETDGFVEIKKPSPSRAETALKRSQIIDPYPPLQRSSAAEHVMDSFKALFSSYDKEHTAKKLKAHVEKGLKKMAADELCYTTTDASSGFKSRNTSCFSSQNTSPQVLSPINLPTCLPNTSINPITLDRAGEADYLCAPRFPSPASFMRPGQGVRLNTLQRKFNLLERTYACKIRSWILHIIIDLQRESSTRAYDHFKHQLSFTPTGEVEHWTYVADANLMWRDQCIIRLHELSYGLLERIRAEHADEQEWEGIEEAKNSVDPTWRFRARRTAWQDMAKFWKLLNAEEGALVKDLWLPIVQIHYGLEEEDIKDPFAFGKSK